ncbi:MAG: hypothetical protein AB8F78_18295 [Saprospiraceae bacterium]
MVRLEHIRISELVEELSLELQARGFTRNDNHLLWAKDHPRGLVTLVVSFAPDDEEGGWLEPFVGYVDQKVETELATYRNTPNIHGMRHTLLAGSTQWDPLRLARQPAHSHSETLEASNQILKWWAKVLPDFRAQFVPPMEQGMKADLTKLNGLFNDAHPLAIRLLKHEMYRAMRGLLIAKQMPEGDVMVTYDYHRKRMMDAGWWDAYGEQIRVFAMRLI